MKQTKNFIYLIVIDGILDFSIVLGILNWFLGSNVELIGAKLSKH